MVINAKAEPAKTTQGEWDSALINSVLIWVLSPISARKIVVKVEKKTGRKRGLEDDGVELGDINRQRKVNALAIMTWKVLLGEVSMLPNLENLLSQALEAGADQAEVYYGTTSSRPVFFESNRLKQLESTQSAGLALRVWRSGCPGLAVAYGSVDNQLLIDKALALASLSVPAIFPRVTPRQQIYPSVGQAISVGEFIHLGQTAIASLRDKYPDILCSSELSCETETTRLLNSEGLDCQLEETANSFYLGVEWIRGEDFLAVYEGDYQRDSLDLETVLKHIDQRLNWALTTAYLPAATMPVLFTPGALGLFWDTVAAALNGKQILEGASPWSQKEGELVIHPSINLCQDPRQSPQDCPFDDEGSPCEFLNLIQGGKVRQFYCDLTTAHALGRSTTGNGFRPSLGHYPSPNLVNLIVAPGATKFTDLVQSLERGLIVDQILGGGADISGDFSVNVDLGFAVEKGEVIGRVKDTMITGNIYRLLNQNAVLGSDQRWVGSCLTPSLLLEGVAVVSAN